MPGHGGGDRRRRRSPARQPLRTGDPPGSGLARPPAEPRHELLDYALRACPMRVPRDVPEPPSTASDGHQQQPVNLKLARALKPRATHGNTLVMRRSAYPEIRGVTGPGAG